MRLLEGFTAYSENNNNLGLVKITTNMLDLLDYGDCSRDNGYYIDISFIEKDCSSLVTPNFGINLTFCKEQNQKIETWKIGGFLQSVPITSNKLTASLLLVKYYLDGDEQLYWDITKYIHRIRGVDYMKETRKNLALD